MGSVTIRASSPPASPAPAKPTQEPADTKTSGESDVEVPFTDYRREHGQSLVTEYFDLGQSNENEFEDEIEAIESYFKTKVDQGKFDNSPQAVKDAIKKMERLSGMDKSERTVLRVSKLAAYVKFLQETENIDKMAGKYGQV